MALQVSKFSVENNDLLLPSHVSLVSGLSDFLNYNLAEFNNNTIASAIGNLSKVYLGINANAVSATKATNDGDGKKISTTYYKKTDTVANATNAVNAVKATQDSNGNVIIDTYITKSDVVTDAKNAVAATYATYDSANTNTRNAIRDYIIGVKATNDNHGLTFTRGTGETSTFSIADTTYDIATFDKAGLMSAIDKVKLDTIDSYAQAFQFINTAETDLNHIFIPGAYRFTRINSSFHHAPAYFRNHSATSYMLVFGGNAVATTLAEAGTVVQLLWNVGGNNFFWRVFLAYAPEGDSGYERYWHSTQYNTDTFFANPDDSGVATGSDTE